MNAREISTLWIIGVAAVALIIWDHRNALNTILNAVGGGVTGQATPDVIISQVTSNLTTNNATPMAGNEFGSLATRGGIIDGDVQPNGLDKVFGSIWDNLGA